jgi:hypothetical protein
MIEIPLRRGLSKFVASPREVRREQGKTDHRRQGKRPAVGPAYVVGCVRGFGHAGDAHCWRSQHFLKGNQSRERRRPKARSVFAS